MHAKSRRGIFFPPAGILIICHYFPFPFFWRSSNYLSAFRPHRNPDRFLFFYFLQIEKVSSLAAQLNPGKDFPFSSAAKQMVPLARNPDFPSLTAFILPFLRLKPFRPRPLASDPKRVQKPSGIVPLTAPDICLSFGVMLTPTPLRETQIGFFK